VGHEQAEQPLSDRRSFDALDGGVSTFDLARAREWKGLTKDRHSPRGGWGTSLFRSLEGIWIKLQWDEFDGPRMPRKGRLPFWQVSLKEAAQWFHENHQTEPTILHEDVDRERQSAFAHEQPATPKGDALGETEPALELTLVEVVTCLEEAERQYASWHKSPHLAASFQYGYRAMMRYMSAIGWDRVVALLYQRTGERVVTANFMRKEIIGRLCELPEMTLPSVFALPLPEAMDLLDQVCKSGAQTSVSPSSPESSSEGAEGSPEQVEPGTWPKSLDSKAVGIAHELLKVDGWINVAEVARRLNEERTKLYRQCPTFMAMVEKDRASGEAAKSRRPRGSKDPKTGTVEGWADFE
jgi:hypothetical protein